MLQLDIELLMSKMQKKISGHRLRLRDRVCHKIP